MVVDSVAEFLSDHRNGADAGEPRKQLDLVGVREIREDSRVQDARVGRNVVSCHSSAAPRQLRPRRGTRVPLPPWERATYGTVSVDFVIE